MIVWEKKTKGVIKGVKDLASGGSVTWRIVKPKGYSNFRLYLGESTVSMLTRSTIDELKVYAEVYL